MLVTLELGIVRIVSPFCKTVFLVSHIRGLSQLEICKNSSQLQLYFEKQAFEIHEIQNTSEDRFHKKLAYQMLFELFIITINFLEHSEVLRFFLLAWHCRMKGGGSGNLGTIGTILGLMSTTCYSR